jgi:activator of 2-hydroxyglutaryl-CoA dehydratase
MVRALEERLGKAVNVPEHSEYVCATGAALLGLRRLDASSHKTDAEQAILSPAF